MNCNSGTLQRMVIHARVVAGCLLLFAFSGCIQATPGVKPTDQPSITAPVTTEPTNLPTLTSTAIDPSPTATTFIESDLSFEAFPVTEGETLPWSTDVSSTAQVHLP